MLTTLVSVSVAILSQLLRWRGGVRRLLVAMPDCHVVTHARAHCLASLNHAS